MGTKRTPYPTTLNNNPIGHHFTMNFLTTRVDHKQYNQLASENHKPTIAGNAAAKSSQRPVNGISSRVGMLYMAPS
jgi:hypothetical protein